MTNTPLRRIELRYEINHLSISYEERTVPWDNAELTSKKDFTAEFRLWEDNVEPENIWEARSRLIDRKDNFLVGLKYIGNLSVVFNSIGDPTYFFDDELRTFRCENEATLLKEYLRGDRDSYMALSGEIYIGLNCHIKESPTPLPSKMPSIPSDLHGKAAIIIAADDLTSYPDLKLKLAYLIVEESKIPITSINKDEMKLVRDFVSHPICNNTNVIAFIGKDLPSAKCMNKKTVVVRFNRNDPKHIAFVEKHATQALNKAKELFNSEVIKHGSAT